MDTLPSATDRKLQRYVSRLLSHQDYDANQPQAFAALNLRNIYSFGMNYFISSWISSMGPLQVFSTIGGLHIFIMLLTIPMWIFGKRCRSLTARVPFFKAMQGR